MVVVVHEAAGDEAGGAATLHRGGVGKFGEAFAVGDGDRDHAALHAGEEDAGRGFDLHGNVAAFVALALVLHEARPVVGAGDDAVEVAHHLAAVADAECEGVFAGEEGGEFGAGERGGHLDFTVHARLAENRDGGAGGGVAHGRHGRIGGG